MIPNVSPWTFYLSYLHEITLEFFRNERNGQVELLLRNGRLMLCAENAVYSYDEKYENFVFAFRQLAPEDLCNKPEVLVLGMGLASIPLILERQYGNHFSFTLIEYDEDVAELAQRYSLPRLQGRTEIVIADALLFMEMNERRFDLICVDLFHDKNVPERFLTLNFLKQCREALTENGLLIMNTPGNTVDEREESRNFFEDRFRKIFTEAEAIHLFKNQMLFSSPPRTPLLYGQ